MKHRFFVAGLAILFCYLNTVAPAFAQTSPDKAARAIAKIKDKATKFGVGANVKVKLRGSSELKGTLLRIEDTRLIIKDKSGSELTAAYSEITSIGNPGMSKGSKIALGVVIGFGTIMGIALGVCGTSGCGG